MVGAMLWLETCMATCIRICGEDSYPLSYPTGLGRAQTRATAHQFGEYRRRIEQGQPSAALLGMRQRAQLEPFSYIRQTKGKSAQGRPEGNRSNHLRDAKGRE